MKSACRITAFLLLLFNASISIAQEKHEVEKGETLFSISQEYGVDTKAIRKANELGEEPIEPGQILKIPASKAKTEKDTVEHTVEEGETLYSICKEYNAEIDAVLELNPDARDNIEVGQVLRIPVGTAPPEQEGKERFPYDSSKAGFHYHPVKKGETLFSLSQHYDVPIDTIRKKNSHLGKEPEVGQLLRIPKKQEKEAKDTEKDDPLALPDSLSRKGYRIHKTRKGETLYSIARRNGLTVRQLSKNNPQLKGKELKKGQALRIPEKKRSRTPRSYQDTLILHTVKEGESIRSIATMYGSDPSLIVLANELFFQGLEKGSIILVPIPPRNASTLPARSEMKDQYRVTLILPLYLAENDSILRKPPTEEAPELHGASSFALEFYEGFRIAADSVAQHQEVSFDIHTIPSRKGDSELVRKMKEAELRKSDLVVGPFYSSNLKKTAKYLKNSNTHHICPVRHSNKVLLDHPYISKAIPSSITLIKQLAEHLALQHGHRNVLLLDSEKPHDDRREQVFRERFDRCLPKIDSAYRDSIPTISLEDGKKGGLRQALKKDTMNILVAPNKEKVFASRIMNKLSKLNKRLGPNANYPVKIFAAEEWKDFSTVDMKYKERFQLHIITSRHILHDSIPAERFYKSYRERNNTDPGSYGFLGHDVGSFYLNGLAQFGTGFSSRFEQVKAPTLHIDFDLFRTGVSSGYENRHTYLIRYTKDHHIERMETR